MVDNLNYPALRDLPAQPPTVPHFLPRATVESAERSKNYNPVTSTNAIQGRMRRWPFLRHAKAPIGAQMPLPHGRLKVDKTVKTVSCATRSTMF